MYHTLTDLTDRMQVLMTQWSPISKNVTNSFNNIKTKAD